MPMPPPCTFARVRASRNDFLLWWVRLLQIPHGVPAEVAYDGAGDEAEDVDDKERVRPFRPGTERDLDEEVEQEQEEHDRGDAERPVAHVLFHIPTFRQ